MRSKQDFSFKDKIQGIRSQIWFFPLLLIGEGAGVEVHKVFFSWEKIHRIKSKHGLFS
jgi:hypothetical protein